MIVLLASAVPVKTGVVLLVMLSVLDEPLSLALVMSGALGAIGAVVSRVYACVYGVLDPPLLVTRAAKVLLPESVVVADHVFEPTELVAVDHVVPPS